MDSRAVKAVLARLGQPAFRLKQVRQAVFGDLVASWDEVSTLPKAVREALAAEVPLMTLTLERVSEAKGGGTRKALFRTHDGHPIEAVLMRHEDGRRTVCVSSQAGCPMACTFCATGKLGLARNLTAAEILDQAMAFARELKPLGERVSGVVMMGMGEPLHNLDNVLAAMREMNAADGLGIGARRLSISTCGIIPGIQRLAAEPEQFNLAVSLHAPSQALRERLMPVARVYPLDALMAACREYVEATGRKVFFEYLLIKDLNDSLEAARELAVLMRHPLFHVNLIKYHATGEYEASSRQQRAAFQEELERLGVAVTFRLSFGEDIDAACGQLAAKN
jgi:23S rRNA (adenine2503-C2)-methyltransferase